MKKKIIKTLLLIFLTLAVFKPLVIAQEATDSAISDDDVKEKIKEKLEEVIDKSLDDVKGAIEERIIKKYYGYTGDVKSVTDSTIVIASPAGDKEVEVASQAALLKVMSGEGKSTIELADIETGDFVLVIGLKKDGDLLLGKRVIISDSPTSPTERKILNGKVKEIDDQKISFGSNGDKNTITISKNTVLKVNGKEKPLVDDIQIGDFLYSVVTLDEDGDIDEVKQVLILPGEANPAAEENEVEASPDTENEDSDAEEESNAEDDESADSNTEEDKEETSTEDE
ncbi:hypothetical protein ACFLZ1_01640 [Patescibacteria group bacterium]